MESVVDEPLEAVGKGPPESMAHVDKLPPPPLSLFNAHTHTHTQTHANISEGPQIDTDSTKSPESHERRRRRRRRRRWPSGAITELIELPTGPRLPSR